MMSITLQWREHSTISCPSGHEEGSGDRGTIVAHPLGPSAVAAVLSVSFYPPQARTGWNAERLAHSPIVHCTPSFIGLFVP